MLPVDPSGAYPDVVGIVRFEPHYELVGGVNAPKKLTVLGTDGRRRPLLLKGEPLPWSCSVVGPSPRKEIN